MKPWTRRRTSTGRPDQGRPAAAAPGGSEDGTPGAAPGPVEALPDDFHRALIEHLDSGLVVTRGRTVLYANPAVGAMTGADAARLTGRDLATLFVEPDQPAVRDLLWAAASPESQPRHADRARPAVHRLRCADAAEPVSVILGMTVLAAGDPWRDDTTPARAEDGAPMLQVTIFDASRETDMERALLESERRYRELFENALEGIYQTTLAGRYINVNPALARIYGYAAPQELIESCQDISSQIYAESGMRDRFRQLMDRDGVVENFEAKVRRKDGRIIWITENARCVRDASGTALFYEGTVEEITERKRSEENLRLMAKVVNSVHEGIIIVDRNLLVWGANEAYQRMTGCEAAELLNHPARLTAVELHDPGFEDSVLRRVEENGHWRGEVWGPRRSGVPFPMEMSVTAVRDRHGTLTHYVAACIDITKRKRDEEHIRFQANYDMLTHLPNRYLIMDRLEQALLKARRDGTRVCVLFLDLDRFKHVNDSFGHAAGDELLKLVARRLRQVVRMSDTVGRLGGDEFVIVLTDVADGPVGDQVADKVVQAMSEPFQILDTELFCLPSIGITYFPDQADTVEELLRNADVAMYHAKHSGDRRHLKFADGMAQRSITMMNMENDLRHALNRNELELHYQPKVGYDGLTVVGAEALIRWRHPRLGLISPAEFIPLAEDSGLIIPIGHWTLATACQQLVDWRREGLAPPSVSVNVSVRQFNDSALIETVRETLERTGLPAGCLDLEITESVMTGDVERAVNTLNTLKAMGVTLSMDDFGTGYSSLNYLKTFPIDTLKIDQTFVRDVGQNPKDTAIVATIVSLARNLGFNVVAEGVETDDQVTLLRENNCRLFQGYWASRPLAATDFTAYLKRARDSVMAKAMDETAQAADDGVPG